MNFEPGLLLGAQLSKGAKGQHFFRLLMVDHDGGLSGENGRKEL